MGSSHIRNLRCLFPVGSADGSPSVEVTAGDPARVQEEISAVSPGILSDPCSLTQFVFS